MSRSNWSSKTGMILAATGSAVGLGAIWKFPYMAGANGGSAFIIPFILMVLFFGVTLILAEIIIGRAGRGKFRHEFPPHRRQVLGSSRLHRCSLCFPDHDLLQYGRRMVSDLFV